MKTLVAIISSVLMFLLTWLIVSIPISFILSTLEIETIVEARIASFAGIIINSVISGIVAINTFRASLKAKTWKLFTKENNKDSIDNKI